jgi:hypothetical protein
MEELKRQMIEAVAALDKHDEEMRREEWPGQTYAKVMAQVKQREGLVLAVAGVARSMVALWKAEDEQAPCGAELAGHVCGRKGAHAMHEDARTGQRWPGIEVAP